MNSPRFLFAAVPALFLLAACSGEAEQDAVAETNAVDTLVVNNLVVDHGNGIDVVDTGTQVTQPAAPATTGPAAPAAEPPAHRQSAAAPPPKATAPKPPAAPAPEPSAPADEHAGHDMNNM